MHFVSTGMLLLLPAVISGFAFHGKATAQERVAPIGIVDAVSGRWLRVQGRQPLARGQLLYAGQTVAIERATTGSLRILLFASSQPWEKTCTERDPCAGTYRPSSAAGQERNFWAFLSAFFHSGQQLPPVLAGSRDLTGGGPVHAYVRHSANAADLQPALASVPPGRYTIRLVAAPGGSLDGAGSAHEASVALRAGEPLVVTGVRPGLYVLSVTDEAGQAVGSTALVLVRDAADGHSLALWSQARENAAGLGDVSPATRAALLAQTLYALDAQRD